MLLERDTENGSTVAAQKRKLARQRDVLSGLKAAAADVEKRQREADLRVTEEYRRCTEQFKDLQVQNLSRGFNPSPAERMSGA